MNPNLQAFGQAAGGPPMQPQVPGGMPGGPPQFTGPEQSALQQRGMGAAMAPRQMQLAQIAQSPQARAMLAQRLAQQGRGGDTTMVHATPGEIMVPPAVQTPRVLAILRSAFAEAGENPATAIVGSPQAKRNPQTGVEEHGMEDGGMDLPSLDTAPSDPTPLPVVDRNQAMDLASLGFNPASGGQPGPSFFGGGSYGTGGGTSQLQSDLSLASQLAQGAQMAGSMPQMPAIGPGMFRDAVDQSPLPPPSGQPAQAAQTAQAPITLPPPVQPPLQAGSDPYTRPLPSPDQMIKDQYGDRPGTLGLSHDFWKNAKLGGLGAAGVLALARALMQQHNKSSFIPQRPATPPSQIGTPAQMLNAGIPVVRTPQFAGFDPRQAGNQQYNFYPNG